MSTELVIILHVFLLNPCFLEDNCFLVDIPVNSCSYFFLSISPVPKYVINNSGEVCHGLGFVLFWGFVHLFVFMAETSPPPFFFCENYLFVY